MTKKKKKPIPFEFVFDLLESQPTYTKHMFGCLAIYIDDKIIFILRERQDHPNDNGIWVATYPEHHQSLRRDLPSLRSIEIFGPGETAWQNIPVDSDGFEEEVDRACEFVVAGDQRFGRIPKSKLTKKKKKKTKKKKN